MESLTTIAMQQQVDEDDDDDDDRRTLDRLASFAAISDTGVASTRRLLATRQLATGRRLSLPDTAGDMRKADAYVEAFYPPRAAMLPPVLAMALCPSVRLCLTQVGVLSKRLNKPSWFLACELPSTHVTLCYKEIRVSPKIRILPSGTLSLTPDLENFSLVYRS